MSGKTVSSLILFGILAIVGLICFTKTLHVNDVQNLQVIQSSESSMKSEVIRILKSIT